MSQIKNPELSKDRPEKKLITILKYKAGRSKGKVVTRHKGGQAKRFYRKVDFRREKFDIIGIVKALEYDPNRSAWIALIFYVDGAKSYILAPSKLKAGDKILSSKNKIEPDNGNRMPLKHILAGAFIYNIELARDQGGKIVRSAGNFATLMGFKDKYAQIKLPSGEIRLVSKECSASLGQVSNKEWRFVRWGKAGRMRHRGIRPTVRGKAMAPVAHPHGGGEGGSPIGLKHPKTPWGKPALGVKTRSKKKWTNKYIVKHRKHKKRK